MNAGIWVAIVAGPALLIVSWRLHRAHRKINTILGEELGHADETSVGGDVPDPAPSTEHDRP